MDNLAAKRTCKTFFGKNWYNWIHFREMSLCFLIHVVLETAMLLNTVCTAMLLDTFGWKVKSEAGMVGGLPPGLQISGEAGKCSKKLHCTAFSGRKHLPKISPPSAASSSSSARPGHFLLSTAVPSHFVISLPLERGTSRNVQISFKI